MRFNVVIIMEFDTKFYRKPELLAEYIKWQLKERYDNHAWLDLKDIQVVANKGEFVKKGKK